MNEDKKAPVDTETILMTLDQIGQTIDIMTNVVGRLRGYITEQAEHFDNADRKKPDARISGKSNTHTIH